ncbi:hypothetical protein O181_093937 [Austropuccinia psidii MF-1]|uniref:Uncharacterized protein n=1 Tax=Austropuccinia psidii MF-1 TaxID=1389203 RepID=A0A9Q3J2F5_9BASI|nr:hypothetical protein [Austropuccinia psidii MF-1]
MRLKGAKGGRPLAPKARWVPNHNWAHLSLFGPKSHQTKNGHKDPQDPFLAKHHHGPLFSQRPPDSLRSRGILPIPPCIPYSRLQEWCIYGIKYHYAPFLLTNPMVTLSGPNSMIPSQGPKIQSPFQRRTLQLTSLKIHGSYQKTIQGPQPPGLAGVLVGNYLRIIPRDILRGY